MCALKIKKSIQEILSERRETVWSISDVNVRILRELFHNTRGLGRTDLW